MQIRPLQADEVDALVDDLWLPFAEEMGDIDDYDALAEDVDVRAEALDYRSEQVEAENTRTFVAVAAAEESDSAERSLRGYVTVADADSPPVFARGSVAKVKDLYVAPAARGEGVGTELLERAHEWGRDRGCERAALSVHADNDAARSCYESMGYETRYLKLDRPL
ncbi:GNAT family N-acetyltransferase [Haloferax sp. Atlit-10N]|uniref:Sporulation regulator-like protein n=1 Tax=Haloferax prahovense (strain DSM 18310 / JCM 13924 / TL6) TaxID=1227461 RepID=M0G4B7_HALPT|nr:MULTISPECIES: GNAT family N-acetyltransferase [Haloferax]ELZ66407.1 sporulation regulator-like protein [Haloferax prahovense DSM 18310]RDZ44692.1 GNAT family N-acetyltransferase [Haloferax sp. Atlit-16N]RDZ59528.1 GNAT family N-acetyltransferase [Haloferax sp. Atlit-10N]